MRNALIHSWKCWNFFALSGWSQKRKLSVSSKSFSQSQTRARRQQAKRYQTPVKEPTKACLALTVTCWAVTCICSILRPRFHHQIINAQRQSKWRHRCKIRSCARCFWHWFCSVGGKWRWVIHLYMCVNGWHIWNRLGQLSMQCADDWWVLISSGYRMFWRAGVISISTRCPKADLEGFNSPAKSVWLLTVFLSVSS